MSINVYEVLRNYRTPDGESFMTRLVCDRCNKPSTRYINIRTIYDNHLVCKGCLVDMIKEIDEDILKEVRNEIS